MHRFSKTRIAVVSQIVLARVFDAIKRVSGRMLEKADRSDRRRTLSGMTRRQMVDIGVPPEKIRATMDKRSWQKDISFWR
jgi:uncharacterized protein YjiS (DUF1127 family)